MKKRIRQSYIQKRNNLNLNFILDVSERICEQILSQFPLEDAQTIALYYPFNQEVNVLPIIEALLQKNKRVVLPKVLSKTTMGFFEISHLEDVEVSAFGVKEPISTVEVPVHTIDWMFIPGVAFNPDCYRLGYGAGYYDRFLQHASIKTVGVAYDFQITDEFIPEAHDVPLMYVITENRLLQHRNEDDSSNPNMGS